MFAYIGSNLINLDKVLLIENRSDKICITFENKEIEWVSTNTPEKDLENIFQMTKDSE